MKIQIISHTTEENEGKLLGRGSILPFYFKSAGQVVDHILKKDWSSIISRYRSFNPDIIVVLGPIGAYVLFLKKIGIIKCKILHDWNDNYSEVFRGFFKSRLAGFCEKYLLKNADFILSPAYSRFLSAKLFGREQDKDLFYLPHGVKDFYFKKYKPIRLPGNNKKKLIYVGELSKLKRTDLLISALGNNKSLDVILIGTISEELKNNIPSNFYLLGQKKQEDIPAYLHSADFLIVTENNDSALKLFEYLSTKKPILAPLGRIELLKSKYPQIKFYREFKEIPLVMNKPKSKDFSTKDIKTWKETINDYLKIIEKITNDN